MWEEYREGNAADGYSYSRFCELYHGWARRLDVVMRHDHRAGEKLFVDYAGAKIPMHDRQTGEVVYQASIFVAVLGASSYTFAEATLSQELACWIGSHVRALEFLGGVPEAVIPDNVKTGVKHPCRYEPDLNPTYREMAAAVGVAAIKQCCPHCGVIDHRYRASRWWQTNQGWLDPFQLGGLCRGHAGERQQRGQSAKSFCNAF